MGQKVEKTFEERLASLKKGCIILGILQAISFISAIINFTNQQGNILTVIFSGVLLSMLYFIYKYTKERNSLGPTLENIFGIILLINGIILSVSIIGISFGIIDIILSFGIIKEAKYFKAEIMNN